MAQPRPSAKHEAWRYSDHDALAELWPLKEAERVEIAAGEAIERSVIVDGSTEVHDFQLTLAAGAEARLNLLNLAARYGRVAVEVRLHRGARFTLDAVQIGGGATNLEIVTTVSHLEPDAVSRQTVRSVLGGRATGTYLGKIAVARGAQGTDSAQQVRAMLLDRSATANAKPELEIYADDVKCAHGAAVGELDREALFYLASRGLPPAEARTLLLQAFVAEVFANAADRETLAARTLAALAGLQ